MCFQVDLMEAEDRLYLDQLDNYALVAKYAKGRRCSTASPTRRFAQACALAGAPR